jgi:hypothetical protein
LINDFNVWPAGFLARVFVFNCSAHLLLHLGYSAIENANFVFNLR